jgi:hypothetical protein
MTTKTSLNILISFRIHRATIEYGWYFDFDRPQELLKYGKNMLQVFGL